MGKLYSQRNRPQPDTLRYDVPTEIRRRILATWRQIANRSPAPVVFNLMLEEAGELLESKYPLVDKNDGVWRKPPETVIRHFQYCDAEQSLDFIEACLCADHNPGPAGVNAVNEIFLDEGIGYSLTPYTVSSIDNPSNPLGRFGLYPQEITYPQIIRRDSEFSHSELVDPAIHLLSGSRYGVANREFLQGLKHYRHGDFEACLNECLKTFESIMKIICDAKKWPYDAARATAKPLIQTCIDNDLFPTFSESQLTALRTLLESGVPTLRNKKAGHGAGSTPHNVPAELARYAINLTASTVLLLVEAAKL
jgi:hypothetical protein